MSGRKFALLVGINYRGTDNELQGCINDVLNIRQFLIESQGFQYNNIVLLTDDTEMKPTKDNVVRYLTMGISQMKLNDTFYFHYSGHGAQIADRNGDERDSLDEVLVPIDFNSKGFIVDDQLRSLIERVPAGSKMIAVIDACHSETSFDLKYVYDPVTKMKAKRAGIDTIKKGGIKINAKSPVTKNKFMKDTVGDVIFLSGCKDYQTSSDVHFAGKNQGALTASFLDILKKNGGNCSVMMLPSKSRDFIIANRLGDQIPRLSFGRSDFKLTKTLF